MFGLLNIATTGASESQLEHFTTSPYLDQAFERSSEFFAGIRFSFISTL
jgi:hypothetical protein